MKKHRLVTVLLIAIMTTGIFALAPPLTSADPWSPGRGPPIVIDGDVGDWDPIKPLNVDPLGDTEAWSKNGTTNNPALLTNLNWTFPYVGNFSWSLLYEGVGPGPGNITEADKCRDLKALYMWFDDPDWIYIRLDVANLYPGWGWCLNHSSWYMITFSTNLTANSGQVYDSPWCGYYFDPMCAWEYSLLIDDTWGWDGTYIVNSTWQIVADNYWLMNIQQAEDYANNAIELAIPRAVLEVATGSLEVVSISVSSFKPGVFGNVSLGETPTDHSFDPQAVINGISPPFAGEEWFQPLSNGPDHADIMAPTTILWTPGEPYGYVTDQKFVDMSEGAKIHAVDDLTDQQNITDAYGYNEQFTINIDIVDAINLTGVSLGMTWDKTVLECLSFTTVFGVGTFLGPAGNWIGLDGTIDNPNGRVFPPSGYSIVNVANAPSGSGTLAQVVFNVTTNTFDSSWICPVDWGTEFFISAAGGKIIVEMPVKNAWFEITPPPPGPGELIYTQTPAAPPHYPGDEIQFNLCGSKAGSNGTHTIPIVNYSLTVWNSSGMISSYLGPSCLLNFTPLSPDTYIFELDIHLDPTVDPAYPPEWLVTAKNVTKIVTEELESGIDCFTEDSRFCLGNATTPFLGKGWNNTADAYQLDEEVTIYSYVFYGGWPRQSKLVSFEVYDPNGTLVLVRTAMTNEWGVANISFRILTVCMDPEYAFGKWRCYQKVYMCEEPYNDTLWFDVGWLVELLTVTPVSPIYEYPAHMEFLITGKVISQVPRNIVWSVIVYDDDDVPIAVRTGNMTVEPGRYCDPEPFELLVTCLEIPKWFYPGLGKVYVNAWFNGLPTECGHPCCPEISDVFLLTAPPFEPDP